MSEKKYRIYWTNPRTGEEHCVGPVGYAVAQAWAEDSNKRWPELHHRVQPDDATEPCGHVRDYWGHGPYACELPTGHTGPHDFTRKMPFGLRRGRGLDTVVRLPEGSI